MPEPPAIGDATWQVARAYHEASKHHVHRFARSPGRLDWAIQPEPFRQFAGAEWLKLPLASADRTPAYDRLFVPAGVSPREVTQASVGELFQYSLGITARRELRGSRWALRANPSAGNLHPTEGYLVCGPVEGVAAAPGVYHYAPDRHGLERRTSFSAETWQRLMAGFPEGSFLVGLSSIHWRMAWKYGDRAYRYCELDLGHALACVRFAAAALGWRAWVLEGIGDARIGRLLGLDRVTDYVAEERETAGPLIVVVPAHGGSAARPPHTLPADAVEQIASGQWLGKAHRLSSRQVAWQWVDQVSAACVKPETGPSGFLRAEQRPAWATPAASRQTPSAARIIRQRRSPMELDGRTGIPRATFYAMLGRLVAGAEAVPWDAMTWGACVSVGLFVHRVEQLPAGLYMLARRSEDVEILKGAMEPGFAWTRPDGCPEGLELYLLAAGDRRREATAANCQQEIAGQGAFSLAMLADWAKAAAPGGAWGYRRMFWEAGIMGQLLYLEAEAAGLRGKGIGCYFDELTHQVFRLRDGRFQSVYHFTVGRGLEQPEYVSLPPYSD